MTLPKEFHTPRYESLPEGLKARADAIINKKFGIKPVEAKAKRQKATVYDLMQDWGKTRYDAVMPIMNWDINFNPEYGGFAVQIGCLRCGIQQALRIGLEGVERTRVPTLNIPFRCSCAADAARIPIDDFRTAYSRRRERERGVGIDFASVDANYLRTRMGVDFRPGIHF